MSNNQIEEFLKHIDAGESQVDEETRYLLQEALLFGKKNIDGISTDVMSLKLDKWSHTIDKLARSQKHMAQLNKFRKEFKKWRDDIMNEIQRQNDFDKRSL